MKKNCIKNIIEYFMLGAIHLLELIDKLVNKFELENEQFVLDFYDKVNEISVRK